MSTNKYGSLSYEQKECIRAYSRDYYHKHKDRNRKVALNYYHTHKDMISKRRKHERDTNPEYKVKRSQREASPKYKAMRRNYHLKTHYGITLEEQEQMYLNQNGKCAICLQRFEDIDNGKNTLHVDHDHTTGKVRQLLCGSCNCAIGNLNEDIFLFHKAIEYLKKWKNNEQTLW